MVGDKPGCVPHKFSAGYLEVEHGDPAGPQARIQRHSMHWSSSGVGLLTIDGPVITDIVGGVPVKTRALMCGHYERIVGMDQDAVLVTRGARTVVAYVPEDMKHLYLDKGVCEAAVHAAFFPPSVENALTANLAALGGMGAC